MRIPNAAHESRAWRIRELTRDRSGGYRGQMAVYVKQNGHFGTVYMAAIRPFRPLIVYPPMLPEIGRTWRQGALS